MNPYLTQILTTIALPTVLTFTQRLPARVRKAYHVKSVGIPLFIFLVSLLCGCSEIDPTQSSTPTPVIYITDLFHPHGDMDDQVDLAGLLSLDTVDVKAVILENTKAQESRPGSIPLRQVSNLTGKIIPFATGLSYRLQSLEDDGRNQPQASQHGVELILESLKATSRKITIVTVGSLRDLAAAYNRNPDLFRDKVEKIFVFAGETSLRGFTETNVRLDNKGFRRIMNSGLPIAWVPCFDGGLWKNKGRASYWHTYYKHILAKASDRLHQYFIYAFNKKKSDPLEYLKTPVNPQERSQLMKQYRNLWCISVFPAINNQLIETTEGNFQYVSTKDADYDKLLFTFEPIKVWFNEDGEAVYDNSPRANELLRFKVINKREYRKIMTLIAADILSGI